MARAIQPQTTSVATPHYAEFDVMRTVAAFAVVLVHALGPYRDQVGAMAAWDWGSVIALNGALRWSVPVFIMITGALLLADEKPFSLGHYVRRRLLRVLIPFLAFSVFYAWLSGLTATGFDPATALATLRELPFHETYYHLGFFYYFIPLYFLIPFLRPAVRIRYLGLALVLGWGLLTVLRLADQSGPWNVDLLMFGGYLVLGWLVWRHPLPVWPMVALAVAAIAIGGGFVISESLATGSYHPGMWFSYQTINTVLAATGVFLLCGRLAGHLGARGRTRLEQIGRHSLGIYLLHPLFLWPVRAFDLYAGPAFLNVVFWAAVAGTLAYATSELLSRSPYTRWLVPS